MWAHTALLLAVLITSMGGLFLSPERVAAEDWITGDSLETRLSRSLSLTWHGRQLRDGLDSLADSQQIAIFLDRRVDPNQEIELTVRDEPLQAALVKTATAAGASVSRLGDVIYIGPPDTANKLRTLAHLRRERIKKLPEARRRKFLQRHSLKWPRLGTPQDALAKIEATYGIEAVSDTRLPHDLWPKVSLPPLDLADQLTLVTATFGQTFEVSASGERWRLAEIPAEVTIDKTYTVPRGVKDLPKEVKDVIGDAHAEITNGRLHIRGTIENHERIMAAVRSLNQDKSNQTAKKKVLAGANASESIDDKRVTLRVSEARLSALFNHVEDQLGLTVSVDPAVAERNISLDTRVSVDVSEATVDEFFAALLKETGLTFQREGRAVNIAPAE